MTEKDKGPCITDLGDFGGTGQKPGAELPVHSGFRRRDIAAGLGVAVFGYCVIYTAATASLPPEPTAEVPERTTCRGLHQTGVATEGITLGVCTPPGRSESGTSPGLFNAGASMSACEAVEGYARERQALTEGKTTDLEVAPALPAGQTLLVSINPADGAQTDIGIVYPDETIAVCGPLEWSYTHRSETLTQHIPSDKASGELTPGESYAYEVAMSGELTLVGIRSPDGTIHLFPDAPPL